MHPLMQDLDVEEFWILLLNQHHQLIKKLRIARGGITATTVDIRLIIREAVLCNATQLVACHNHPSGNIMPSKEDDKLTLSIMQACKIMSIHFADHMIITDGAFYSYYDQGKC